MENLWWIALIVTLLFQLVRHPQKRNVKGLIEFFLLFTTLVNVGLWSLIQAILSFTEPSILTKASGSLLITPLQYQIAIVYLTFTVLGVLCYWDRGDFWFATILGFALFTVGQAVVELYVFLLHTLTISSSFIFFELFIPLVMLVLLLVLRRLEKKGHPRHH